ncbi:MAG: hypothetical protein V3V19_07730 [Cocleimonas sp.]
METSESKVKRNTINHNALKHLIEANSVKSATAVAKNDTWFLQVVAGDTKKTVMAKNSGKPRIWRKLETLTKYLKGLGLDYFIIDASNYDPSIKSLQRPDSAAILKRTHKAHKSQEVQEPRPILGRKQLADDAVKEKWEERRAKILQQEDPRAK